MWLLQTTVVLLLASSVIITCGIVIYPSDDESYEESSGMGDPIPLTMANVSFDDRYEGCASKMGKRINGLLKKDLKGDEFFRECWMQAKKVWMVDRKANYSGDLKDIYATAIVAYTMPGFYLIFNQATRTAGRSYSDYKNYPYKALHFLLSYDATLLKEWPRQSVYRGSWTEFSAEVGHLVRFGQFTSTSIDQTVAKRFGENTQFIIEETRYGYPVEYFSRFPTEQEVLIPPFEMFSILSVEHQNDTVAITMTSRGKCSNWNCVLFRGKKQKWNCPKHTVLFL